MKGHCHYISCVSYRRYLYNHHHLITGRPKLVIRTGRRNLIDLLPTIKCGTRKDGLAAGLIGEARIQVGLGDGVLQRRIARDHVASAVGVELRNGRRQALEGKDDAVRQAIDDAAGNVRDNVRGWVGGGREEELVG